ncbi:MAG: PaaI family thioesterase [Chloroflexi bacterium]|nr:PaaI family thioesterase [Chloroflexota bacterium]MDA1240524.1 PaaI family thioesterase [Chloroflexota bacterium]MQC19312.1 PaaI family thioesterase [Chloroflexota bacterium]
MTPPEGDAPDTATLLARVDAKAVQYWTHLGIVVERTEQPGEVTLRLPMQTVLGTRRPEVMHGGAVASLIDACAGAAVISFFAGDEDYAGQATLDLNVTFLSAATSDAIAEARLLRSSRTLAFTQVDVKDASGTLLAVGRATYTIIRKR